MDKVIIKELNKSDLSLAAEVIRAGFSTVAIEFGLTEQNCPNHTSFITTDRIQNHFNLGWPMYGLYQDKKLVGYVALLKESGGIYELHNLAVLPEYRHKGYGKQLLDYCKSRVKEQGGNKIAIGIIEENTILKYWYATNGFVHTGIKKFAHLPFAAGYMEWEW